MKNDHFRFFFYELFLHFSCIMVEKERFKELGYILHNTFIVTVQRYEDIKAYTFVYFRNHVTSLNEIRNSRLQLNRVSITADTLKERATGRIKFPDLQKIDALLYYISLLVPSIDYRQWWFPETSCYHYYGSPFMAKAVSKKFFEKVKPLFNVETKEELVSKVKTITEGNKDNFPYHQYWIHPMSYGLQIEKICTIS